MKVKSLGASDKHKSNGSLLVMFEQATGLVVAKPLVLLGDGQKVCRVALLKPSSHNTKTPHFRIPIYLTDNSMFYDGKSCLF